MQFLLDNLLPISVAVLSGAMLFWSFMGDRIRGIQRVNCIGATQLINHKNALILDVRSQKEYDKAHILNSKRIPAEELKTRVSELEKHKEKPILIVCHMGGRAGDASTMLAKQGFSQTYVLDGGIAAWQKANLPVGKK